MNVVGSKGVLAVFLVVVVVVADVVRVVLGRGLIVSEVASASASWSAALSSVALAAVPGALRAGSTARARVATVDLLDEATGMVVLEMAVQVNVTFRVKSNLNTNKRVACGGRGGHLTETKVVRFILDCHHEQSHCQRCLS